MPDKISKFIASLDEKTRKKLKKRMQQIRVNPYKGGDVKKMQGFDDVYRLRVGKIRIIYRIVEKDAEIIDIDYRGNIY